VRLWSPLYRCLYHLADDRGSALDMRRVTGSAVPVMPRRMMLALVWCGVGVVALATLGFWQEHRAAARRAGAGLAIATQPLSLRFLPVLGPLIPLVFFAIALPRERRERAKVFTMQGRCGACGYGLMHLTSDPDGCRVCPECGGAWRLRTP
jgi:hypothetical protein